MKYHPKTKPFGHQTRATLRAARARNFAFFFEPRCGKSKAGLDTVGIHALAGRVQRVLILCPSIAEEVWAKQIRLHYPYPYFAEDFDSRWHSDKYMGANVRPDPLSDHTFPTTQFFIASREAVFRRTRVKGKYVRLKQEELQAWRPDLIILDESHEYKRAGGVGAQDAWRLVRRLRVQYLKDHPNAEYPQPWVLLMSGTPSPKGWIDLFAQFRIMDESIMGTSKADFEEDHCVYGHGKRKWTIIKYKRERELERAVRDHSETVTAEQAGLANKAFYQRLNVRLPEAALKMYLELAEEFLVEWEGGVISAKNAGVKRIRLLQICGGFTTAGDKIHDATLEKFSAYAKLLYGQGESVVVYSRFTPEVVACEEVLRGLGFDAYRVDGSVSKRARADAIASLSKQPKKPTAISFQHQAGSRAIELVGAAETVYYSAPDGWVEYRQTAARTTGPNQKRPVRYTFLTVPGTVTVGTIRGLKKKEEWHDTLMRDPRAYLMGL